MYSFLLNKSCQAITCHSCRRGRRNPHARQRARSRTRRLRALLNGFNDTANLDDRSMWPVAFALKELTAADERKIRALVKKAVS